MAQTPSLWQGIDVAVRLGARAVEEVRALYRQVQALSREPGPQGPPGPPGNEAPIKRWAEGAVFYQGDRVVKDGSTYQALRDTGREPTHEGDWICTAAKGADAVEPEHCGLYAPSGSYRRLSIVALDGGSYWAIKDDPGPCPGDGWRQLVQRGKPGQRGDRGERGERGLRGETVKQVGWREDLDNYRAFPLYSDGTEGPALPLHKFFERYHLERA